MSYGKDWHESEGNFYVDIEIRSEDCHMTNLTI